MAIEAFRILIRRVAGQVGIPVDRDHPFRFIVTSDSGLP